VAVTRRKVAEGHPERAARFGLQVMHGASEAIGRKPFRKCVSFEERAINFFWPGRQNAVQAYGTRHGRDPF
jgi:hypothetical protein